MNSPLRTKSLFTSFRYTKLVILRMRHGERNCGTLSIRISKIQIIEEEDDKKHRKRKTKHREIIRSIINDKIYNRVHKKHKKIRIIESERG